jgi:hypothetical protein
MRKLATWLSVILVAAFGGKALIDHMSRSANVQAAVERVEKMLGGFKAGGNLEEAFIMWRTGDPSAMRDITQDQYNAQVIEMQAWLQKGGLRVRVESLSDCHGELVKPSEALEPAVVDVSCVVNGLSMRLRAADGNPWSGLARPTDPRLPSPAAPLATVVPATARVVLFPTPESFFPYPRVASIPPVDRSPLSAHNSWLDRLLRASASRRFTERTG